ncbi:hypothetical protein FGG08_004656 [Glutinoglossum americanum]|uniref:Uncharacterized protein n=1 Tax=Glutinoglossum americanum TaxID=1670608 RepID=A0A9P8KZB3_9PEZI|nr:hypothetical protein FGG08_004656 [Glutinoglossum americanum]
METLHGNEPCNSNTANGEAAILNAFFKKGMLTVHAERLVDLALQELGLGAPGQWTADRVKDWIEHKKRRISQRNQFEEVSALSDALNWAVKHPDPDPSNPGESFRWIEPVNIQQSGPEDFGQGLNFRSQIPLSTMSISGSFPAAHEFQLQQNGEYHLGHTGDTQDGFDDRTNIPPSTSQIHPSLQGLDFSSVMGSGQLYPRCTDYFELTKTVASDSSLYARYVGANNSIGGSDVSLRAATETTTANVLDHNHASTQKLDADAQMLLDNFAAYDRMSNNDNTLNSTRGINGAPPSDAESHAAQGDQLAGLLEAVTSAAGQEAAQFQVHDRAGMNSTTGRPRRTTRNSRVSASPQVSQANGGTTNTNGKRKRQTSSKAAQNDDSQLDQLELIDGDTPPFTSQRWKRAALDASRGETSDRDGDVDGEAGDDNNTLEIRELPPQVAMSDARAAGVHSAAALFRRPSASSKKYTRPPMSKLFSSLELSPENFLHLQAAAKGFMLDKNYPERQDCVGSRGKGDTDMVKLRLYNCVKDFLEKEGNGEKFFGKNVVPEGSKKRKFVWPAQKNRIISLVTPLLRRMVTNERQRQYAIETRKGGGAGPIKRKFSETETPPRNCSSGPSEPGSSAEMHEALFRRLSEPPSGVLVNGGSGEDPRPGVADLGLISGLSQADWNVLVATVQEHFHYGHLNHTGGNGCNSQCVNQFFYDVFVKEMGYLEKSSWSMTGNEHVDADAKQEFAYKIVQDLFSAITRNFEEGNAQQDTLIRQPQRKKRKTATPAAAAPTNTRSSDRQRQKGFTQPTPPHSSHEAGTQTLTPPESSGLLESTSSENVKLQINIMKNEDRQHPPFHIHSKTCPDYESLRRSALRDVSRGGNGSHIQVLLGTGLTPVSGDKDYENALRTVRETVWMDKELKVLVFLS